MITVGAGVVQELIGNDIRRAMGMGMVSSLLAALLLLCFAACSQDGGDTQDAGAGAADTTQGRRATVPADSMPPAPQPTPIWKGKSGGYTITWQPQDISVVADGRGSAGFLLHDVLAHRLKMALDTLDDQDYLASCTNETTVTLLSLVGSIMSIQCSEYTECPMAAHPGAQTWYESFDFANPDRKLTLAHFFNEEDIYQALLGDPLVRKTMAADGITDQNLPATLSKFITLLSNGSRECEYEFSDDLLSRFAFHHIEQGKVAVRLGLSHGVGVCRGMLTQIGILLPIPSALANDLRAAESRTVGYLMRDLKGIAGDRTTMIKLQ